MDRAEGHIRLVTAGFVLTGVAALAATQIPYAAPRRLS